MTRSENAAASRHSRWPRRLTAMLTAGLLALGGGLLTAAPAYADAGDTVSIPDTALLNAIQNELGPGPVTETEAQSLNSLDAGNRYTIKNLTGLEAFTNLTSLDLRNNNLSANDVFQPIHGLTKLTSLNISGSKVTDLSGLSGLTSLESLDASTNDISDLSPLVGLTSLVKLDLSYAGADGQSLSIPDFSALTNLHTLRFTNIGASSLAGLSGLALTDLRADNNSISDLSPLQGMTSLQNLNLDSNRILDLSPLSSVIDGLSGFTASQAGTAIPPVETGAWVANPVKDENGDPIPLTSDDASFEYDSANDMFRFTAPGFYIAPWTKSYGTPTEDFSQKFNGYIAMGTGLALPTPEVTQPQCQDDGTVTHPTVSIDPVDGVTYTFEVNGESADDLDGLEPGDAATIIARLAEGVRPVMSDGWDTKEGVPGLRFEITVDTVDCTTGDNTGTTGDNTGTTGDNTGTTGDNTGTTGDNTGTTGDNTGTTGDNTGTTGDNTGELASTGSTIPPWASPGLAGVFLLAGAGLLWYRRRREG